MSVNGVICVFVAHFKSSGTFEKFVNYLPGSLTVNINVSTKTCVTGNNFILHKALSWYNVSVPKSKYLLVWCIQTSASILIHTVLWILHPSQGNHPRELSPTHWFMQTLSHQVQLVLQGIDPGTFLSQLPEGHNLQCISQPIQHWDEIGRIALSFIRLTLLAFACTKSQNNVVTLWMYFKYIKGQQKLTVSWHTPNRVNIK